MTFTFNLIIADSQIIDSITPNRYASYKHPPWATIEMQMIRVILPAIPSVAFQLNFQFPNDSKIQKHKRIIFYVQRAKSLAHKR